MQVRVIRHSPRGKLPPCDPNGRPLCRHTRPARRKPSFLVEFNATTRPRLCDPSLTVLDRTLRQRKTWPHKES